jgi:hypothetical protein
MTNDAVNGFNEYLKARNAYFAAEELYRIMVNNYKLDQSADAKLNLDAAYWDMGAAFDRLQEQYLKDTQEKTA